MCAKLNMKIKKVEKIIAPKDRIGHPLKRHLTEILTTLNLNISNNGFIHKHVYTFEEKQANHKSHYNVESLHIDIKTK